ncbi:MULTISPECIES: hypothetical protein [Dietzia]|uniref:hypothetical protein n=1 Tax=Dietzia TaxID=37914 RepID=UPI0013D3428F|nr:hypothetical protein [Dietzia sp. Alg238-R159]
MSSHPSDALMAKLIRHARTTAAHTPPPTRTRALGEHGLRQCSAGRLVVEAAHCDAGVSDSVGQSRRETVAAELERRRMTDAAEAARAQAHDDRARAEREREDAWAQTRRHDGPAPDFATLAIVAATTATMSEHQLATVIDAAVGNEPGLSPADSAELRGERRVGLSPSQVAEELAAAGASTAAVKGLPDTGVHDISPATLVAQSSESASAESVSPSIAVEVDTSPEVG